MYNNLHVNDESAPIYRILDIMILWEFSSSDIIYTVRFLFPEKKYVLNFKLEVSIEKHFSHFSYLALILT